MLKNVHDLQKEFDETRYVMEAVFNENKDALEALRERQRQLDYQKKLNSNDLFGDKERKGKGASTSTDDSSIRLFEESTIIEMDTEERVYEAVVGADEQEEKRAHSVSFFYINFL